MKTLHPLLVLVVLLILPSCEPIENQVTSETSSGIVYIENISANSFSVDYVEVSNGEVNNPQIEYESYEITPDTTITVILVDRKNPNNTELITWEEFRIRLTDTETYLINKLYDFSAEESGTSNANTGQEIFHEQSIRITEYPLYQYTHY